MTAADECASGCSATTSATEEMMLSTGHIDILMAENNPPNMLNSLFAKQMVLKDDQKGSECSDSTEEEFLYIEPWKPGSIVWARPSSHPELCWWPAVVVERPLNKPEYKQTILQVLTVSGSSSNSDSSSDSSNLFKRIKVLRTIPIFHVVLLGGFHAGGSSQLDERWLPTLQTNMRPFRGHDEFGSFMASSVQKASNKLHALRQFVVPVELEGSRSLACQQADQLYDVHQRLGGRASSMYQLWERLPWIDLDNPNYAEHQFGQTAKKNKKVGRKKQRKRREARASSSSSASSAREGEEEEVDGVADGSRSSKKKRSKQLEKYVDFEYAYEALQLSHPLRDSQKRLLVCFRCERAGELYSAKNNRSPKSSETGIVVVACPGGCMRYGHLSCLGGTLNAPNPCDLCKQGLRQCFICHQNESDPNLKSVSGSTDGDESVSGNGKPNTVLVRCSDANCGRWYHKKCLKSAPFTQLVQEGRSNSIKCPAHACMACAADNPGVLPKPTKNLIRCFKCPAVYHTGDWCIPPGSIQITNNWIICPRHAKDAHAELHSQEALSTQLANQLRQLTLAMNRPSNVSWCFICSKGGHIMCCENCPASFHEECVKIDDIPDHFLCEDCIVGRFARYGDIVWVRVPPTLTGYAARNGVVEVEDALRKPPYSDVFLEPSLEPLLSGMRWWLGEILHPRNYDEEIDGDSFATRLLNRLGFCRVRLFNLFMDEARREPLHLWTTNHRLFPFEEGDDEKIESDFDSSREELEGERGVCSSSDDDDEEEDDPMLIPSGCGMTQEMELRRRSRNLSGHNSSSVGGIGQQQQHPVETVKRVKLSLDKSTKQRQRHTYRKAMLIALNGWNKKQVKWKSRDVASSTKPEYYKKIKCNYPIGDVRINKLQDTFDAPVCECKADSADPCGPTSDCINRELRYECIASFCVHKSECRNQRFMRRQYPPQKPFRTADGRGWGLKALVDIKKGEFVNEYIGDLIDEEEANRRLRSAHENNVTNYYMMQLDASRIIDAGPKGNLSRFANHSCDPNLNTEKWNVNGDVRVGLFAVKDIKVGDELTFNYNFMSLGQEMIDCKCGSSNCVRFLGASKPAAASSSSADSSGEDEEAASSSTNDEAVAGQKKAARKHEFLFEECFRCGERVGDPELAIVCPKIDCCRSYHLACLKLNRRPLDKWFCPWHHCDICGRPSHVFCSKCTSSFCMIHAEGSITVALYDKVALVVCLAHDNTPGKENWPPAH